MRRGACRVLAVLAVSLGAAFVVGPPSSVSAGAVIAESAPLPDPARAHWFGIDYNPDADEYLAAYRTRFDGNEDVKVVRLGSDGALLSGPTPLAIGVGGANTAFTTDVTYNPTTQQYLVSWLTESMPRTAVGQLVSASGVPVGSVVALHGALGSSKSCAAQYPQHEYNPVTGGYTLLYSVVFGTSTPGTASCQGLAKLDERAVVALLGADLSLGTSVAVPHSLFHSSEAHLAQNPVSGDILVVQKSDAPPGGRGVLFSPTLGIERSFSFDTDPSTGSSFDEAVSAADPVSGNWLISWGRTGDAATLVLDAAGDEVVPAAQRVSVDLRHVVGASDGTFWANSATGYLVHVSGAGEELSKVRVLGSVGNNDAAFAFGADGPVRSGIVVGGDDNHAVRVPFTVSWPGAQPVVPARLLETRRNTAEGTVDGDFEGGGPRAAGDVLELQVAGRAGVPSDADAAVVNIAAVGSTARGFVTAFPCDEERPTSSNLNFESNRAASASAFVTLSAQGTVCLFTSVDVELIVDVNGFAPAVTSISSLLPARLLETRPGVAMGTIDGESNGVGRASAGDVIEVPVAGRGGVAADAAAVIVNVTSIGPASRSFATVYACGSDRPTAANLNADPGQNVNNLVLAEIGDDGMVCLYTSAAADFVMDVSAYVPAGGGLTATLPSRLLETRIGTPDGTVDGEYDGTGQLAVGETTLEVAGRGPVPDDATGVMLNVAAIKPTTGGYMTLYPCDAEPPTAANVNFGASAVVSNAVFVKLDDSGEVCIWASTSTGATVDVVGYVTD